MNNITDLAKTLVDMAAITPKAEAKEGKGKTAQRDMVVDAVVVAGAEFWKDADNVAYVTMPREGRIERYKVRSSAFKSVVRALYAEAFPRINDQGQTMPGSISDKAMTEALPSLEAMIHRRGTETYSPALRSIEFDGALWIDLGRPDWSLVRVTREGWQVVNWAKVPLVRAEAMRALPLPDRAAAADGLATLRRLLNLGDDQDDEFMLVVCWLLGCLWPRGPYPILAIDGEQGSGKSTLSRLLRGLVDPNKSPLRAPPKNEADLIVAANAGRVVAIDNVSYIDADMADVICRLATGAGLSKRKLYTDEEEHLVEVCRPILLNGINSVLSRGDVADRALVVGLRRIEDSKRRMEAEIEAAFEQAAPGILAALLDGLAGSLHYDRGVKGELPRMADFAAMVCRAAPAFGWQPEDVLAAINRNREAANTAVVDSDPLTDALRHVLAEHGLRDPDGERSWSGTAADLLSLLHNAAPDEVRRERTWPKDATRLSGRIRRIAPAWRRVGLEVVLPETGGRGGRIISVKQRSQRSQRSMQENAGKKRNADSGSSVPAAFPSVPDAGGNGGETAAQRSQNGPSVPQRSVQNDVKPLKNNDTLPDAERWNAGNAVLHHISPAQPVEVEI
jgi:energy-coupling factor transporter ATP-binding protein EcfA2